MVRISCQNCNKDFFAHKYRLGVVRFCSRNCHFKAAKGNTKINSGSFKKGHVMSQKIREKISKKLLGRIISEEQKQKLSIALTGRKRLDIPWNKGKPNYEMRGEKNPRWKGGSGTIRRQLMQQIEYRLWREAVFERDDYTCQMCLSRGTRIHADHIKPWATYPELRYAIDNGRTLCIPCHYFVTYGKEIPQGVVWCKTTRRDAWRDGAIEQ